MSTEDGGLPAHSPVGSRAEQHVIDDKITLKNELKKAREERDARYRFHALVFAFVGGFILCDLIHGGSICHRVLVMVDRQIHRRTYEDE